MATIRLDWPASPASEFVTDYKVWESVNGGLYTLKATVNTNFFEIVNPPAQQLAWKISALNFVGTSIVGPAASGPSIPSTPSAPTVTVIP